MSDPACRTRAAVPLACGERGPVSATFECSTFLVTTTCQLQSRRGRRATGRPSSLRHRRSSRVGVGSQAVSVALVLDHVP